MAHSSTKKIYVDNRFVGEVSDGAFRKRIRGSKHILHTPHAIALSVESLAQVEQAGAERIEVQDVETGKVYSCTIEHFSRYSFEIQRGGFEPQLALTLNRWDVTASGFVSVGETTATTPPAYSEETIAHPAALQLGLWQ